MRSIGALIAPAAQHSSAWASLAIYIRQREGLATPFRRCLDQARDVYNDEEREAWAQAVLDLANVNVGPSALIAFSRLSAQNDHRLSAATLANIARGAAEIGRSAGAASVRAVLEARLGLAKKMDPQPPGAEAVWWRAWLRLALEAPPCVVALAPHSARIFDAGGADALEKFVTAGLRAAGADARARLRFFRFDDAEAHRILDRLEGQKTFTEARRRMRTFATALWGFNAPIEAAGLASDGGLARRASLSGGMVRVPEVFNGVAAPDMDTLFAATVAHATAHLALGKQRFLVGSLKPLQIVLVGLIEDARIEALAMRRLPGLRHLWARFHVAAPSGVKTATALLARLSRALFDPDYQDEDGFVSKGRELFAAEPNLEDAELSRSIGGLLGNDMGQMRVQFNAKSYVIEPIYRDDGLGLWDFPVPPDAPPEDALMHVEAARAQEGESNRKNPRREDAEPEKVGRARPRPSDERGAIVATYPEWDCAAQVERGEWTTVREIAPRWADPGAIELALERETALRLRIERLIRAARLGRMKRLRRQPEGPDFDLDAAVDAAIASRLGDSPDPRIYRLNAPQIRDVAVSVLIDASESTRDCVAPGGASILAIEQIAVAMLSRAMEGLSDRFALRAFASSGRSDVRFTRVKDFDQRFDREAMSRLAGLTSGLSTRLGAALRHAGAELSTVKATRKILLALTDGAPSDIDVADLLDLAEDARRATLWLRSQGIEVFGIVMDPSGFGAGRIVFGRTNHLPVRRIEELPSRLAELYFRVARR